jgi:hypothetical protein
MDMPFVVTGIRMLDIGCWILVAGFWKFKDIGRFD